MNWRDLKPGDRVRVTFEIDVTLVGDNFVLLGDNDDRVTVEGTPADTATWELLDPPLKVGLAEFKHNGLSCQVLAIYERVAWIKYWHGGYDTIPINHLVNIDEEPQP